MLRRALRCADRLRRAGIGAARENEAAWQHLFVNVARLDWHVRPGPKSIPSLIDHFWAELERNFDAADIHGRLALLRLIERVAYYQPDRALRLVRWVIEHPTGESPDEIDVPGWFFSRITHDDALRALPPILRLIAYSLDHLNEAADLLWRLAESDDRLPDRHPDHAIRALIDLAEFGRGKPLAFNEKIVEAGQRWLRQAPEGQRHSPFEVLEAILATDGFDHRAEGLTISLSRYNVDPDAVQTIRTRAVDLALEEATHSDVRRAVRGVQAIEMSLRSPSAMSYKEQDNSARDRWTPVFVETIRRLQPIAANPPDPIVGVAIRRALRWHAHYSTTATKAAAAETLGAIPDGLEHRLALALHDGSGRLIDETHDYEKAEQTADADRGQLAAAIVHAWSDEEIVRQLRNRLVADRVSDPASQSNPAPFTWTLVKTRPSLATCLCAAVCQDPESPLTEDIIPVSIACLAEQDGMAAVDLARSLTARGCVRLNRAAATAFGWNRGSRATLLPGELDLLRRFAASPDHDVRRSAVRAAQVLAFAYRAEAIDLLTSISFADSPDVAADVFATLDMGGPLAWIDLDTVHVQILLDQLRMCPTIHDYHIASGLSELSVTQPEAVIGLLEARVEYAEVHPEIGDLRELPDDLYKSFHVCDSPKLKTILRQIRDWIADEPGSWRRRRVGPRIFWLAAIRHDGAVIEMPDETIEVLDEALVVCTPAAIGVVAAILHEAPSSFVWDRVDFVHRALNAAAALGRETLRKIGGALRAAAQSSNRSGTAGELLPQDKDIEQRDRAAEIASRLPRGSVEERFYRSLEASAIESIQWNAALDEELLDRREW